MDTGIGHGLLAIASGLLGIALIALILNKSDSASNLISTASSSYAGLLNTVINPGAGYGNASFSRGAYGMARS